MLGYLLKLRRIRLLRRPLGQVEGLFCILSQTKTGSLLLERAEVLFAKDSLKIEPYPEGIRKKLKNIQNENGPVGACFVTDGNDGIIYLDFSNSVGLLLPMLVHELVHATDTTLWSIAKTTASLSTRNEIQLQSEVAAYQAQHQFLREMDQIMPELRSYLLKEHSKVAMIHREYDRDEIAELYGWVA